MNSIAQFFVGFVFFLSDAIKRSKKTQKSATESDISLYVTQWPHHKTNLLHNQRIYTTGMVLMR
jgi:flagellar basal body-associated protein FliL